MTELLERVIAQLKTLPAEEQDAIADAKLQLFDRCGHLPYLEYADEFNRAVLEFLSTELQRQQPNTSLHRNV